MAHCPYKCYYCPKPQNPKTPKPLWLYFEIKLKKKFKNGRFRVSVHSLLLIQFALSVASSKKLFWRKESVTTFSRKRSRTTELDRRWLKFARRKPTKRWQSLAAKKFFCPRCTFLTTWSSRETLCSTRDRSLLKHPDTSVKKSSQLQLKISRPWSCQLLSACPSTVSSLSFASRSQEMPLLRHRKFSSSSDSRKSTTVPSWELEPRLWSNCSLSRTTSDGVFPPSKFLTRSSEREAT